MSQERPEGPALPGEAFEEAYRGSPEAGPLWDRMERWGLVLSLATVALTGAWGELELSLGWLLGTLGGLGNVSGLRRLVGWLLSAGSNGAVVMGALLLKMTLWMAGIWWALKALPVSPVAFAVGYGLAMSGLVMGSVVLARRARTPGGEEPAAESAESSGEGGE
jgi:hypothetical protein